MQQLLAKIAEHSRHGTLGRTAGKKLLLLASPVLRPLLRPFLLYDRVLFLVSVGYWPSYHAPKSFTEKTFWMKLTYRDPRLPILQDKLTSRDYVRYVVPELRIPETFFTAESEEGIPFDQLPNQCVIKSNHASGHIIFFDRSTTDPIEVRRQCKKWLSKPHGTARGEWAYQSIPRRLFGEELLLDDRGKVPDDYKIYVLNGSAKLIMVIRDRFSDTETRTCFNTDWILQDGIRKGASRDLDIPKPRHLQDMIQVAERLADDLPFIRVDLYELKNEICFGEFTFYPMSGLVPFEPRSFDQELGKHLTL